MCNVRPSALLDAYPWYSKVKKAEAEEFAVIFVGYVAGVGGDRWLHEMSVEERGDAYEYAQEIAARMGLELGDVSAVTDALFSPFAAAAFSDDWRKALEQAYLDNAEGNYAQ